MSDVPGDFSTRDLNDVIVEHEMIDRLRDRHEQPHLERLESGFSVGRAAWWLLDILSTPVVLVLVGALLISGFMLVLRIGELHRTTLIIVLVATAVLGAGGVTLSNRLTERRFVRTFCSLIAMALLLTIWIWALVGTY